MKNKLSLLCVAVILSGCASTSEKDPEAYAKSLAQAKTVLKSNRAIELYQKYYDLPDNKAFAQSKVSGAVSYVTFSGSKELAASQALERCNDLLLKRHSEITDKVSCKIVNVNNEWISE